MIRYGSMVLALILTSATLFAQGAVSFINGSSTKVSYQLANGGTSLIPTGNPSPFVAALFWGPEGTSQASLTQIASTQRWEPLTGTFYGGTTIFPVPGGTRVSLQVRGWQVDAPSFIGYGPMQLITLGYAGSPPSPAASLTSPTTPGDTAFTGFVIPVPEPAAVTVGLLGLCVLALVRGKK